MKLYTAKSSNFGARVAIAARAKGVELEQAPIPIGGLLSPAFVALNPVAKIPILQLDDGTVLPESDTILRYLEQRFPSPSLFPGSSIDRALVERVARLMDLYVMVPIIRLFPHLRPSQRDAEIQRSEVAHWQDGLATLAHFMRDPLPESVAGVSLADCVLMPSLHLSTRISAMLALPEDPTLVHQELVSYYQSKISHPIIAPILSALTDAQESKDIQAGLPSLAEYHRRAAGSSHASIKIGDIKL